MSLPTGEPEDLQRIADALEGAGRVMDDRRQQQHELTQAVTALVVSTDTLINVVQNNEVRNKQFRWTMALLSLVALLGIAALTVMAVRLSTIAGDNHSTFQQVESCTVPTGQCYQESRKATAVAIASLSDQNARASAAAAYCFGKLPASATFPEMLACVRRQLAQP